MLGRPMRGEPVFRKICAGAWLNCVVFSDRTLAELASRTPRTLAELAAIPGIGPAKLERYGPELLARLAELAA